MRLRCIRRELWLITGVLAVFLLSGCGSLLAGDVTPPPNYISPTDAPVNATPATAQVVFPVVPPDTVQGAAIYAQKCLPCHGEKGLGDGPQAANLPNTPAAIGSPDFARKWRPVDWFNTVTNGNLEKYMPGFGSSLSDTQRWDVVAYALTLSASPDDLQQGKSAYEQNCSACHGPGGQGDGPQAASLTTKPAAWGKEQSRLAQLSADDIVAVMTGGPSGHPSFTDKLNDSQRYQVAAYIRSLSFTSASPPAAIVAGNPTPASGAGQSTTPQAQTTSEAAGQAVPAGQKITITGKVTNGTHGSLLPFGLKVQLQAYQGMQPAFDLTAVAADDGSYRFENVKFDANYIYFAQVDANGLIFSSDILHGSDIKDLQASLPVQIYDTASDPSVLRVDRMHVFFDFSKPGIVQVVNLYIISNPSDRTVIASPQDRPVINFSLPKGAENLQFQDGKLGDGRYIKTDDGFGDNQAVVPGSGQHQILFAYDMPYSNKLDLSLKAPLPVEAAIVMVPPVGVKLKSSQLTDGGRQNVQGMSFQMYQSTGSLKPGDMLNVSLSGKAGTADAGNSGSLTNLLVGIGAFGLVLAGAGVWMYRRVEANKTAAGLVDGETGAALNEAQPDSSDALLDAILALDDLHAKGDLPDAGYQDRRADLKQRLAEILEKEKDR